MNSIFLKTIVRDILKNDNGKYKCIRDTKYTDIVNRIFELKVAQLYKNGYVDLGYGLGKITISLHNRNNDSIKNYAIDWKATKELWSKDNKAKQTKKLVRILSYDKYVRYSWINRKKSINLSYYNFLPLRSLRKQLYFDVINNKNIMFYE